MKWDYVCDKWVRDSTLNATNFSWFSQFRFKRHAEWSINKKLCVDFESDKNLKIRKRSVETFAKQNLKIIFCGSKNSLFKLNSENFSTTKQTCLLSFFLSRLTCKFPTWIIEHFPKVYRSLPLEIKIAKRQTCPFQYFNDRSDKLHPAVQCSVTYCEWAIDRNDEADEDWISEVQAYFFMSSTSWFQLEIDLGVNLCSFQFHEWAFFVENPSWKVSTQSHNSASC